MDETLKPLNDKQKVFISEYLKCFNGTEAYCKAYPKAKRDSARTTASELLAKPNVKAEIQARLAEIHMSADEALSRMSDIARGDITEFITPFGAVDLEAMKRAGKGHLIKKIKQRTITKVAKSESDADTETHDTEIELYPADGALRDILKIHGKFKDAIELPDELTVRIVRASDVIGNPDK